MDLADSNILNSKFDRPDLIRYVLSQCIGIPETRNTEIKDMESWCQEKFGDPRPGSLLMEAMEGWLDYFDGDWSCFDHPYGLGTIFWFGNRDDRALFVLTWL